MELSDLTQQDVIQYVVDHTWLQVSILILTIRGIFS